MATFYHGTDHELLCLKHGSYVTKNIKDARKFGYRKSVLSGSKFVYVYTIDVPEESLILDKNRDRAYIIQEPVEVQLKSRYSTYQTPHKLTKFKMQKCEKIG